MSRILAATSGVDLAVYLDLALEFGCGLEIQAFSDPRVLEGNWLVLLRECKTLFKDFPSPLACHGAFYDMSGASMDPRVVALTRERYLHNLDIAAEIGASPVVFHTNFLPMIRTEAYRKTWVERQVAFWQEMAVQAAQRKVSIAIENMWDPDPLALKTLLEKLDVPQVRACLDVSHVCLYGQSGQSRVPQIEPWLEALSPYVVHVHINNTMGVIDEHLALNARGGVINYARLLPKLAHLPQCPNLVVEIADMEALRQSLAFVRRILGEDFEAT